MSVSKVFRRPRVKTYSVRIYDPRIRNAEHMCVRTTGEKSLVKAYNRANQIDLQICANLDRGVQPSEEDTRTLTIEFLLEQDLERLVGKRPAKGHIQGLGMQWKRISEAFPDLYQIDDEAVLRAVRFWRGPDDNTPRYRNQSITKYLQTLVRMLKKARDTYGFSVKVPSGVPKLKDDPPCKQRTGRDLTKDEMAAFFAAIRGNPRLFNHMFLIASTALRSCESQKVSGENVREPREDVADGVVAILELTADDAKWDRPRRVALTTEAREAFLALGERPYSYCKVLTATLKTAGQRHATARDLRHSIYRGGPMCGDPFAVKLFAGHKELDRSCYYIHTSDARMAKVATAHAKFYRLDRIWADRHLAPSSAAGRGTVWGTVVDLASWKTA